MTPWWLLFAPAAVGLLVLSHAFTYWRGTKAGRAEGYVAGLEDAEEALASEEQALDSLCRTLDTDRAGFRALMREADRRDRDADTGALPDARLEVS